MRRVLVVDDEPNIVRSLEVVLGRAGFAVEVARDGGEALAAMDRPPPDLLLLDVMMPEFDGFEVCQRLRDNPDWAGTRIVMLTARGRKEEQVRGMALGADAYVTKPFSTRDIVELVNALVPAPAEGGEGDAVAGAAAGAAGSPRTALAAGDVTSEVRARRSLLLAMGALLAFSFPVLAVVEAVRATGRPFATLIYLFAAWAAVILGAGLLLGRGRR